MKHYSVNIIINYEVEGEDEEDAMNQADIQFGEDTHPWYDTEIVDSWEVEEDV